MQVYSPVVHDLLHCLLVVIHLLAMAVAVGVVFWQDIALLKSRRLNALQFRLSSVRVARALIVLWLSGLAMIALDTGFDFNLLAAQPKIQAKLLIVTLLSLNGWALHRIAFPTLLGTRKDSARKITLITAMGAISTVSWVYAIFLGIARPLVHVLGFGGFVGLYIVLLIISIGGALFYVRPRIETLLIQPTGFSTAQIMAILFGLGATEAAGGLSRREGLERYVRETAAEARRQEPVGQRTV